MMGITARVFVFVAGLGLSSTAAFADPDTSVSASSAGGDDDAPQALPCRPTIACTAEIVPAGNFEFELGVARRRGAIGAGATDSLPLLAKYSVTDHVQLQLGTNNVIVANPDGSSTTLDGVFGGPKVVLIDGEGHVPTVAVSAFLGAPTRHDAGATVSTYDAYVWGYASTDVAGVHADLNLGIDILGLTDHPGAQGVAALSLSHDLAAGFGVMLEGYTFQGGGSHADHDAGILSGITYAPVPQIMFDLGGDVGLYRDTRRATLFAGVTFVPAGSHHAPAPSTGARVATR